MFALIEANLELCQIAKEERSVIQAEATDFLKQASRQLRSGKNEPWDIVFFDPPYATDYLEVLDSFGTPASSLLTETGLLIVEHHHKKLLPDELGSLRRTRILKQGDSALSFYEVSTTEKQANLEIIPGSAV
jgi:16S rRNA G966 N2-methylase RsmD